MTSITYLFVLTIISIHKYFKLYNDFYLKFIVNHHMEFDLYIDFIKSTLNMLLKFCSVLI